MIQTFTLAPISLRDKVSQSVYRSPSFFFMFVDTVHSIILMIIQKQSRHSI